MTALVGFFIVKVFLLVVLCHAMAVNGSRPSISNSCQILFVSWCLNHASKYMRVPSILYQRCQAGFQRAGLVPSDGSGLFSPSPVGFLPESYHHQDVSSYPCLISKCLSNFGWQHLTPASPRFLVQNAGFGAFFGDFLGSNFWIPFVTEAGLKFGTYPKVAPRKVRSVGLKRPGLTAVWMWLLFCLGCRCGEAHNPGPAESQSWKVGIFNPSGLNSKLQQAAAMEGEVWLASETHLTQQGIRWFKKGLKSVKSTYTNVVAGAPCVSRSQSQIGSYSGVLAMASVPLRALPHSITDEVFNTGRCQVVGFLVGESWVQAGIMYGFPDSSQHQARTFQTDTILSELVQRVGLQASGPRLIAGDFNHGPEQLSQCEQLRKLGFCEAQQFACMQWGVPISLTTKGDKLIDQMWLSPELLALLRHVEVLDMEWADHSSVQCTFTSDTSEIAPSIWRMPTPAKWPDEFEGQICVDWQQCPTAAYAAWWYQIESQAGLTHPASKGRGQTLKPKKRQEVVPICPKGRSGDFQPSYFGPSLQHLRWVKQLRRCQALRRLIGSANQTSCVRLRIVEVWKAIRNSPGFEGGFCKWWQRTYPNQVFSTEVPLAPPKLSEAQQLAEVFGKAVAHLEHNLSTAHLKDAKLKRAKDLTLVFRDCAKDSPDRVDTLLSSVEGVVAEICPEDQSIVCQQSVPFSSEHPLVINGHPKQAMFASEDQVWLNNIEDICVGDAIRQEVITTSDQAIMDKFEELWAPRWNRIAHLDSSRWERLASFVQAKFRPIQWSFPDWNLETLKSCVQQKKASAAVGPDGVSRTDLLQLPDWALQPAVTLFDTIEKDHIPWPQQLATGIVSGLAKTTHASSPDAFRPITVYPILYRVWGTVRAKQALQSLAGVLPMTIRGGIPSREARTIWYETAQHLEWALMSGQSLGGVVLDIRKAFNSLPRMATWIILRQLGFPRDLLLAWGGFLAQQTRHFKVRRSVSAGLRSVTGYPEGCAMSVFAMAIIDWCVEQWVQHLTTPETRMLSFVDDWQFHFCQPEEFQPLWNAIAEVTRELDLVVDEDKTFVWAAQAQDRAILREQPVSCLYAARDLGAHQNYCRRAGNKTITDRISGMIATWKALRSSLAPVSMKAKAVLQMAWPRALHGVSIVKLGSSHYQSLRTGFVRGLRMDRIGSNPALVCASFSLTTDPEMWAIFQTIKDARTLGCPQSVVAMASWFSAGDGTVPRNGPGAVLHSRIQRLGWQFLENGKVCDFLGSFDLVATSLEHLRLRMMWSWPKMLAAQVSHRNSFQGLQFADIAAVAESLKGYGAIDQTYLRCALDGTMYVDVGKSKEQRGKNSLCIHCAQIDSFYHRIWECPAYATCRASFPWPTLVHQLPKCLSCHGWAVLSASWLAYQGYLAKMGHSFLKVELPCIPHSRVLDLFVDGACACPTQPKLRFASWALTMALPWVSMLEHKILSSGHLNGCLQSAYRAELVAMAQALNVAKQVGSQVRIWGDNLAVLRLVRRCLKGTVTCRRYARSDLVSEIIELVDDDLRGRVRVHKVTSHCHNATACDSLEEWAFWHNQLVDEAAHLTNYRREQEFWTLWEAAAESLKFQSQVLHEVQKVLLQVGRADKQMNLELGESQQNHVEHNPRRWEQPDGRQPILGVSTWSHGRTLHRKYLQTNIEAFHNWWVKVGVPLLGQGGKCRWISGMQLYADFQLATNYPGILARDHKTWYDNEDAVPDDVARGFAARSTRFIHIWNAYMKFNKCIFAKKLMRPASGVLSCWTQCLFIPWSTSRLDIVDRAILFTHGRQIVQPQELDGYLRLESEVELPM